ncbi:MAG TPA: YceI family protein [Myxococcota bacterium]|nr:YceI family protein [Myxococcota bacterium]
MAFFATATLHDFEGVAPCAVLAIDPPDASAGYRARAEVAVDQLDTGISARNARMREMFEAQKFPRIIAVFEKIDPQALRVKRALPFRLAIHGVERDVSPELSDWSEVPGQHAHFRATFDVALSEFGMEAPTAAGLVRVGDRVRVVVDVELGARPNPR